MWYVQFRCGCATKAVEKSALPKRCPKHCATGPTIWEAFGRPSTELRRALYKLEKKPKRDKRYNEYQAAYHMGWVDRNRDTWNEYQRKWREKKRGYPAASRYAPGVIKALITEHGVTESTIYKWIRKGKLKVKKDYRI